MNKLIVGFVGEIASGKGTACDHIINQYQAGYFRFSTILRDILDRLHLEQSRQNMQKLSTTLRQSFNEDLFAKVIAEDVQSDNNQIICVDGIRREADIKYLKELPNFHLIHISANEQTRFERIKNRSENPDDKNKSFDQFQKDQQQETELTIPFIIAKAEYKIDNNGEKEILFQQLDDLIEKLK